MKPRKKKRQKKIENKMGKCHAIVIAIAIVCHKITQFSTFQSARTAHIYFEFYLVRNHKLSIVAWVNYSSLFFSSFLFFLPFKLSTTRKKERQTNGEKTKKQTVEEKKTYPSCKTRRAHTEPK